MANLKNISAVERTFKILEQLSQVSSTSLENLARTSHIAKPTVYRFLMTLKELGYVKKDEGDRWFLTMKLFSVGSRALDHIQLPIVARPICEKLSERLGETVHMGILDENEALYVVKIESRYTIRMYSRVGKHIPLYCTAIGKVLLAYMEEKKQKQIMQELKLVPFTPHTIKAKKQLLSELVNIRNNGFAQDREEHEEGITCIAAPIFDSSNEIVAAVSVSWPVFRFSTEQLESNIKEIRGAAMELSRILGYLS
ncbi:IclR family transcriptional regulator [Gracilinema caldarium]|uniref:Transcriptional regulator, IclR family n=1 Tax=Gracilinema caldarium (strain ATCC 51460 / DSM 7334 / H1) TaxID=744872 RepID=F8F1D9_GRAC1|nr:IclR family transcriptional regulator [Gracilinema caldarium]AEJ18783.1 transcriptional regulator, IclR family [Gracilinema caldarium DSM 7334]